ncbi:carboxy terminal-processing peptidase [Urechidicola croceus]|uniref:Tail specific protease domain-containing protein n=1 Tax=Urechidicola croceus TaxID=1850246 RepID=A0A1D8PA96_9FLAO|nr:carboxy terminal-processing peptidase [Urechidicola croceus]AOW21502.1 hypothetical protein LPB138_12790 [Urechidicola croceus]
MKKRLLFLFAFLLITISYSQSSDYFCEQLSSLKILVENQHYQPKKVNDSLSSGVLELFIENLDPDKQYFTESDIESFEIDKPFIDDYINSDNCSFIDKYISTLKLRVKNSKKILLALNEVDLDYTGKDILHFIPNSEFSFYKDEQAIENYLSKKVRYSILTRMIDNDSIIENITSNFTALEKETKPEVIQNQLCLLDEILNQSGGIERFVEESFLNAFVHFQDPNSTFFNTIDKTIFENSLSSNQQTFGILTDKNKKGEIVIAHIIPGSAAFKNGNFEVNDVIISCTNESTILETLCVSNEDVMAFLNEEQHQSVLFKIKKKNTTIHSIKLKKSKTKVEENSITGYVIKDQSDYGYIKIPSFYTNLESPNGLGLANDVAKQLYKLQKENINGLIIDLRFNGGGSMKEAADLSGMFIDRGPLSILRFRDGETFTTKDMNRGKMFSKPIVILINNFSASASEYFASVMQDYNRAIIVGSPSHGKSTAQIILPLDLTGKLGFCKLTIEKFYRVTGKSNQSVGVIPDITLPSLYDGLKTGEQFEKYALKNDSINYTLKHLPLKDLNLQSIISKSKERVEKNSDFDFIKSSNNNLLNNFINKRSEVPLTLKDIYDDIIKTQEFWESFSNHDSKNPNKITVKNTTYLEEILQYNKEEKQENNIQLKNISKDIYIEEATHILNDFIIKNTTK